MCARVFHCEKKCGQVTILNSTPELNSPLNIVCSENRFFFRNRGKIVSKPKKSLAIVKLKLPIRSEFSGLKKGRLVTQLDRNSAKNTEKT